MTLLILTLCQDKKSNTPPPPTLMPSANQRFMAQRSSRLWREFQMVPALLFVLAAAGPMDLQFDLVCTTHSKTLTGRSLEPVMKDGSVEVRLDLGRQLACQDDCASGAWPIPRVEASAIVLRDSHDDRAHPSSWRISRVTGEYHSYMADLTSGYMVSEDGSCVKAPFKGFPATKF